MQYKLGLNHSPITNWKTITDKIWKGNFIALTINAFQKLNQYLSFHIN